MKKQLSAWGKSVKIALVERSWSISDLATEIGLSREYVTSVINERVISPSAKKRISDVLNIQDDDSVES